MKIRLPHPGLLVALALVACGGGGGGGGSSSSSGSSGGSSSGGITPPPSLPTFTVPGPIAKTADAGIGQNPISEFDVSLSAALPADVDAGYAFSENGVANVAFFTTSDTVFHGVVYFEDPTEIGPGVYTDTITIGICSDDVCTSLRNGTTRSIPITYTITGTVPPPVSASAATSTLNAQAQGFTDTAPVAYIDLNYLNVRANQSLDITATSAYRGIGGLNYEHISETSGRVRVNFKNASTLLPGTYDDTISISVCQGNKCPTQVVGAPITVNAHYVINNTVGGANGFTVRVLNQDAIDLNWNAATARLYLVAPPTAAQNANSLVALDPVSGTFGPSALVGNFPTVVASSDDGQFAYVISRDSTDIKRFKLPALTPDISISMGSDSDGPLAAQDVKVAPGLAHTIAVVRIRPYPNGRRLGAAIFDDATARPNIIADPNLNLQLYSLQWNGTNGLYAGDTGNPPHLSTLAVDANGASLIATQAVNSQIQASGAFFQLEGGKVYFDRGVLYDPATATILGTYDAVDTPGTGTPYVTGLVADAANNRAFALVLDTFTFSLQSYDLTTRQPIANVPLTGLRFPYNGTTSIRRWGVDGLALITDDGHVVLINGAFVKP